MARLRVRYRTGDTDEWELHEQLKAETLFKSLTAGLSKGDVNGFSVASESGTGVADYGWVTLNMEYVVMWHIDGLVDFPQDVAMWQPDNE